MGLPYTHTSLKQNIITYYRPDLIDFEVTGISLRVPNYPGCASYVRRMVGMGLGGRPRRAINLSMVHCCKMTGLSVVNCLKFSTIQNVRISTIIYDHAFTLLLAPKVTRTNH